MTESKTSTALAVRSEAPITTPAEFNERVGAIAQRCHILSPAMAISAIAPMHAINISYVVIDSTVQMDDNNANGVGTDVYYSRALNMKPNERALSKVGLMKISAAGGVSWRESKRADDRTIQNMWEWSVMADVTMPDGAVQPVPGSALVDYRDGSAQIAGMSEKQLLNARKKGLERAETLAMERAIRAAFGLKHKYTVEELKRPFAAFKLAFQPDMNDADTRAAITAHAIGASAALYGSRPAITGEVVPAAASTPVNTATGEIAEKDTAPAGTPFELDDPATAEAEPTFEITGVFNGPSGGFYITTRETGTQHLTTDDKQTAIAAKKFKEAGKHVHLDLDRGAIVEMREAGEKL